MEQRGIVHRDIKPSNILINTKTLEIKICDFGLSRSIIKDHSIDFPWKYKKNLILKNNSIPNDENNKLKLENDKNEKKEEFEYEIEAILSKFTGTLQYKAPEILLLNDSYDMRIDVWGVGCVLAELLSALDL